MILAILGVIVVVLIAVALLQLQRRFFALQYLFFLRVPLFGAFGMFVVPAVGPAELFDLQFFSLTLTSLLAVWVAWAIVYAFAVVYVTAPDLHMLSIRRTTRYDEPNPVYPWMQYWRLESIVLTFPLIAACVNSSDLAVPLALVAALIGWAFAFIAAVPLRAIKLLAIRLLAMKENVDSLQQTNSQHRPKGPIGLLASRKPFRPKGLFLLTAIALVTYLAALGIGFVEPDWLEHIPALAYILSALMLSVSTLTLLSFFLDRYRMPSLTVVLPILALTYFVLGGNYFFETTHRSEAQYLNPEQWSAASAIRTWHELHPIEQYPVIVVVAVSGGGIAAGAWGTVVLAKLTEELGPTFSESIVAISAVSGGAMGAMYFVDAYDDASPDRLDLVDVVRYSMQSSLSAMAWGMFYVDGLRSLGLVPRTWDRGWALERKWSRSLRSPEATIASWASDVATGKRPALLFNATLVETGQRLLIAPVVVGEYGKLGGDDEIDEQTSYQFATLYEDADIAVATAARLSATFPFVTPLARPDFPGEREWCRKSVPVNWGAMQAQRCVEDLHIADGGYFDNYGVMTALEYLETILTELPERKQVLLVQIRISRSLLDQDDVSEPVYLTGGVSQIAGPLMTVLNVNESAQIERNNAAVRRFVESWSARGVEVRPVEFVLEGDVPLSWHLSDRHKRIIYDGTKANADLIEFISRLFRGDQF